jgi:hypothetical protein
MNTNTPISVSNGYSVSGTAQRGSEDSSLIKNYKKLFKFNLTRTAGGQLVSSIKGSLSNQGHSAGETAKKVGAVFGKTLVLIATVPFFIAGDASAFGLGIIVTGLAILPVGSYKAALAIRDIIHRNTVSMATLRGFDGSKVPTEITTANEKECVRKVFNLTTGQFLPLKDIVDVLDENIVYQNDL